MALYFSFSLTIENPFVLPELTDSTYSDSELAM